MARDAEEGGATVQKSIQGFGRVRDSMTQSAGVIREMGKRASEIGSIVDTINMLAERTNLLSLNASIEAARAGDAGRGFAVIAEEIRNLADRSARATSDIAAIIRGLQDAVQDAVAASSDGLRVAEEGSRLAEDGAAGLKKILSGIEESTRLVGQIARATDEQISAGRPWRRRSTPLQPRRNRYLPRPPSNRRRCRRSSNRASRCAKSRSRSSQAMNEQSRAARTIIKSAQNTTMLAGQVHKAAEEQASWGQPDRPRR